MDAQAIRTVLETARDCQTNCVLIGGRTRQTRELKKAVKRTNPRQAAYSPNLRVYTPNDSVPRLKRQVQSDRNLKGAFLTRIGVNGPITVDNWFQNWTKDLTENKLITALKPLPGSLQLGDPRASQRQRRHRNKRGGSVAPSRSPQSSTPGRKQRRSGR